LSKYDFLKRIIYKNGTDNFENRSNHIKGFDDIIKQLPQDELNSLKELYSECCGLKLHQKNQIDIETLRKFLKALIVSEFRIDDILLHPPEIRHKEIESIANSIGLEYEMVIEIHKNWHGGIRTKIFENL
jgi:hypothetical protein